MKSSILLKTVVVLFALSAAGAAQAQLPDNWKVLCKTKTGEVRLSKEHPAHLMEFTIMRERFGTYAEAKSWTNANCPRWRCTTNGTCAHEPAYGGEWKVICHLHTKQIAYTSAHMAHFPDYREIEGRFLSMLDAQLWVSAHHPNGRCDELARGGKGAGGKPGKKRSRGACTNEHCPSCKGAVTLLGQSASPQCQTCKKRKRAEIDRCAKGSPAPSAKPSYPRPAAPAQPNLVEQPDFSSYGLRGGPWSSGLSSQHPVWENRGGALSMAQKVDLQPQDPVALKNGFRSALALVCLTPRRYGTFGSTFQRVVTEPGRTYRISVWVAASGVVSHGAFGIVVDPQMQVMPIVVSAGTYGWTQLSGTFVADRSGHTDLRIIAQDRGAIWLTGLEIK